MTRLRRAASWALFVAWAAAVWWLSSRSRPQRDLQWPWEIPDKLAHGVEFAIGGFLAARAFSTLTLRVSPAFAALATCAVWAAVDEIHQGFVPNRTTDPWDLAADVAGVASGVLLHAVVTHGLRAGPDRGSR